VNTLGYLKNTFGENLFLYSLKFRTVIGYCQVFSSTIKRKFCEEAIHCSLSTLLCGDNGYDMK